MMVYKTHKFKMYIALEQKSKLNSFLGSSTFIYNTYLYKNKDKKYFSVFEEKESLPLLCSEYPF